SESMSIKMEGNHVLRYIVKRLLIMVITQWLIVTLTFLLIVSILGSPFNSENSSYEFVQENLEKNYHLELSNVIQYLLYIKSIITFDFGPSIKQSNQSVNDLLWRGFPISFELGIVTIVVAVISGVTLGVIAALRHNGVIDYMAMAFAVL